MGSKLLVFVLFEVLKYVLLLARRSSKYSNNFADMEYFLYLCIFTLVVITYTIPAESKHINILIIFLVNFFYNNIFSVFRVIQYEFQFRHVSRLSSRLDPFHDP